MLRTIKPKNARSKRALEAREAQVEEKEKTAIFVRGEKISDLVKTAMKDLHSLKLPNSINFSKKNPIHPFDADPTRGVNSLEFFSDKNDASLFVVGMHSKKKPNGLVWVRCFNGQVLDMIEVGLNKVVGMSEIKSPKSTPGHRLLMIFQSPLFATHPSFILLKSMLLDFYNGHEVREIPLMGIEAVMTITAGPLEGEVASATGALGDLPIAGSEGDEKLPEIHLRTYTMKLLSSGGRLPKVHLNEMGPSLDFNLRRIKFPSDDVMKEALRKPKLEKKKVEAGQGKKRKNIETDDMGDLVGKIHVGKQELGGLQSRKMKGLREVKERKEKKKDSEKSDGGRSTKKAKVTEGGDADVDME